MLLQSLYLSPIFCANQLFIACLRFLRGVYAYLNLNSLKPKQNDEMPQEMNVLCCYSCSMYQVHIVKKSNKWQCKICGKNQSIQVVYFQGTGSECRKQVQHLNYLKAKTEDEQSFHSTSIQEYGLDCVANDSDEIESCDCPSRAERSVGKWEKYLESDEEDASSCEFSDKKETLLSSYCQENFKRRRKHEDKRKQSYSLPSSQISPKMQCEESKEWSHEPKAGSSRSRTYPLVDNSLRNRSKWSNYLDEGKEDSSGKVKVSQNEITAKESASFRSKNNIFEDSNDDLNVIIDF